MWEYSLITMRNNILASIALFGEYRQNQKDIYDLIAQFITAVLANKQYVEFTPEMLKSDLFELYQIDIPLGVIKSVSRKRINGAALKDGVFTISLQPNDEITGSFDDLMVEYESLFKQIISFVRIRGGISSDTFTDEDIKAYFKDYLIDGCSSERKLDSLYALFLIDLEKDPRTRQSIDLLSSGLISYNGLRYADEIGESGSWTDKLVVYLDTEFLFNCSGYNGEYASKVFNELYSLVSEVNNTYHRKTGRYDNLIQLKYLKDTRDVYLSLINTARSMVESKMAPDPSKKALIKIIQESETPFSVDIHKSKIDSIVKDTFQIVYDDNDYDSFITDPRYVIFDESTTDALNKDYNPQNDETITRKVDYVSRVLTIINGLRKGKSNTSFEKCGYVFLTGSRIGRGASIAVLNGSKGVPLSTDIDFLISRIWFRLNKSIANNRIPVSLDIVARSQAVISKEVTRKVQAFYDSLVQQNLPDAVKKSLYVELKQATEFLEPYNQTSIEEVCAFMEYSEISELLEANKQLKSKAQKYDSMEVEISRLKSEINRVEDENTDLREGRDRDDGEKEVIRQKSQRTISLQRWVILVLFICLLFVICFLIWVK